MTLASVGELDSRALGHAPVRVGVSCLLLNQQPFGVGSYIVGLVEGLRATSAGRSLVLYHRGTLPPMPGIARVEHRRAPRTTGVRAVRVCWEQVALPKHCQDDGIDVLHAPGYIAPAWAGVPSIVTVHDAFTEVAPQFCKRLNRLHHSMLLRRSISRARLILTPSDAVRRQLQQLFPREADKIVSLLPGIDTVIRQAPEPEEIESVKRRYRLPTRFALWAGNLEPKKNVEGLLAAFRIARRRGLDCELVMVGGRGWGSVSPHALASEEGVRRLGYVSRQDLRVLYREALMLCFPSFAEGMGFPVLEAMATGAPVVCSTIPAAMETDPRAVELIDPEDPESIAEGMCRVASDADLRARMIAMGREATKDLSWERYATWMWRLYERLL
jgi:glycosyltransferase involved in cell wall biosynthesis